MIEHHNTTNSSNRDDLNECRFPLGQIVSTPGAMTVLSNADVYEALGQHARGDWGLVGIADREENELSLAQGFRLMSVYESEAGTRIWIITEADRSVTTVLLPEEY